MSVFICKNPKCSNFGISEEYTVNVYKIKDGKLISNNAFCPKCGKIREEISDNDVSLEEKNINIGNYTLASSEGRRDILKKRSHEHFLKEIKSQKQQKLNEAITDFKKI